MNASLNFRKYLFFLITILVFLDPLLFKIDLGPITITSLRVILIISIYYFLYELIFKPKWANYNEIRIYLLFFLIWFSYGGVAVLWSNDPNLAIRQLYYFSMFILFILLLVKVLSAQESYKWVYRIFWVIGVLMVGLSFIEMITNIHLPTSRLYNQDTAQYISTGFFYNENDHAYFLVLIAPFFLLNITRKKILLSIINAMIYAAIFIVIYINDSKAALISLFLQIVIMNLFILDYKKIYKVLLSSVALFGIIGVFFFTPVGEKVLTILNSLKFSNGSAFVRLNLYLNGLYALSDHWFFGVGPGNFITNIYENFNTGGIINPHNWWIEILTEYGVFIFGLYLLFFVSLIIQLFKIGKSKISESKVSIALFLSFIGFILASIGPSSLFYHWTMWLFYGVAIAIINNVRIKQKKTLNIKQK
ncbi:O-antigen ligase family protein [Bacillus aquiflavi]|uniref:O-antigen ligase family protein n=1 Tax=Bacillus aquiflavi TaxID=2672567 RepID=A0A6B3VZK1_9BACI|nr:O-antigen ligase family protein [Bacillus aquiflavi]MBA4538053.1 O-antigen ligase family protein [Bacillus aquiflavi]NEY82352.1 O-antigen ligase family protein [Bacillus aquiflavi]UAC47867.1 O-antigen ligase family protein [Bacillus aquiflavi]